MRWASVSISALNLAEVPSRAENAGVCAQSKSTLATYASPVINALPVSSIETAHVLKIIWPIWHGKPESTSRIRGRIENVLSWTPVTGYRRGEEPARWQSH
jgi:hypothetical protein